MPVKYLAQIVDWPLMKVLMVVLQLSIGGRIRP
jgi:hypothetical protein